MNELPSSPPQKDQQPKETVMSIERVKEYCLRSLTVLRQMRSEINNPDTSETKRMETLEHTVSFTQRITREMVGRLLDEGSVQEVERVLQMYESTLKDVPQETVVRQNLGVGSVDLILTFAELVSLENDIGPNEPFPEMDLFIREFFHKTNITPVKTFQDLEQYANEKSVIVAPLSAGLLLVSFILEYLKVRQKKPIDIEYTTASPTKQPLEGSSLSQTYVPGNLQGKNDFLIVDDAIDSVFGTEEECFHTMMSVEHALKQKYGNEIVVNRGSLENIDW